MAAGILPKPGSKLGPCKRCEHRDCQQTRADAVTPCRFCGAFIGYGRRFVRSQLSGALAHEACVEAAVERNSACVDEF